MNKKKVSNFFANVALCGTGLLLTAAVINKFFESDIIQEDTDHRLALQQYISNMPSDIQDYNTAYQYINSGVPVQRDDGLCFLVDTGNPVLMQQPAATYIPCIDEVMTIITNLRNRSESYGQLRPTRSPN
jgi:hypothetical protein